MEKPLSLKQNELQPTQESKKVNLELKLTESLLAGLGGFLAILLISKIGDFYQTVLLIAPFGASSVIAFAFPASNLARPRNIIGGHLLSAFIGVAILNLLGASGFTTALAVGLAITSMLLTNTAHPPAGGNPILVMTLHANWSFALWPVGIGAALVVIIAVIYHKLLGKKYPDRWF